MSKNVLNIKIDNENENNKTPIFNHNKLNDSIKTNNYHKTLYNHNFKPVVLKLNKNNEINKTLERKNSFNQISNQIIVAKNLKYKQFKKPQNLNPHTFDNYWLNKAKKASIIFNNSLLNEKYHKIKENQLNYTKVRNQYLRLNNVFNPHKNYSEVVTDRKHIIKAFLSQTKTNFNNNYYLIYSDPDRHKRNYISKCFDEIKKNNRKNMDKDHSIKALAEREIYNKSIRKIFNSKKRFNKKNNLCIEIPSSFDVTNLFPKTNKLKIQTLNIADNILKEYADPFKINKKKNRIAQSAFFKKEEKKFSNFFKTRISIPEEEDKLL